MANWFDIGKSIIGGIFGLGSSATGAGLSYKSQKKLQEQSAKLNYDYSIKSAQNMANATRIGYENAGLNPMLMASNGVSGSNSFTGTGSAPNYDLSGGISSGVANAQSIQRLSNETKQADSVVDLNDSTASKNLAETSEIMERLPFVGAQAKANLQKTQAETTQLNALSENYKARLELDRMLGLMNIKTTERGQDKIYNASTYASDKNYRASIFSSSLSHPYARWAHKVYNSGKDYKGSYSDPWSYK